MTGVPESSQLVPMGKESGTNAKQVPVGDMTSNALTARVLKQ